ncbi:hypothetical protein [Cupriavidus sp. SW-Y-13]|uniref:hypothetical protein n=1 Tax=Cupriavidus sp. SW-Y-13 TaxID=2653854 RepID=UPI0013656B69|nr:hypothetical protein [Cupriavidus sp. SW-Y-13]MWL91512.1 hypothetical protein [Cupriavidus sp. SW-Y-13]
MTNVMPSVSASTQLCGEHLLFWAAIAGSRGMDAFWYSICGRKSDKLESINIPFCDVSGKISGDDM